MQALTANDAKTQFGDMLLTAQREPIQINKNGKPVAMIISVDEYNQMEEMKLNLLKQRAAQAVIDIENNNLIDSDSFLEELADGKHD